MSILSSKSRAEVQSELVKIIQDHQGTTFDPQHPDLMSIGVMDSYTMLLLINHVQNKYGIELDMEKIDFDVFRSLPTFLDLLFAQAKAS